MASSVYPAQGGVTNNTRLATFIPEIWSNELIAAYRANLTLQPLIRSMNFVGKKGDVVHVPKPVAGTVSQKVSGTAVSIQADTAGELQININQNWEYSRLVEDITKMQALNSQREFFISDAAHQLSKKVDTDLHNLGKSAGDGDGTSWVNSGSWYCDNATGNLAAFAEDTVAATDVFTDQCYRQLIQKADDANVPMSDRAFVIPPSLRNAIMGIDRYVSSDFVDRRGAVSAGLVGEVYGIPIFVSTNCPVVEAAADNSANTNDLKQAMLLHKDSLVIAIQQDIKTETQYKLEWLSDLVVSSILYGTAAYRPESFFNLVVNA